MDLELTQQQPRHLFHHVHHVRMGIMVPLLTVVQPAQPTNFQLPGLLVCLASATVIAVPLELQQTLQLDRLAVTVSYY